MNGLLREFLAAATPEEADHQLAKVIEFATPLMVRCLHQRGQGGLAQDAQDVLSAARTQLIQRLYRWRAQRIEAGGTADGEPAVSDFGAYVTAVTYNAWSQDARRRHPARAMLLNRLRYVLEGRTNQRGFALWTGLDGKSWASFEVHRGQPPGPDALGKTGHLLADPAGTAREIFGAVAPASLPLADLVVGVLTWLGGPVRLCDLTDVLAVLQDISTQPFEALPLDADEEPAAVQFAAPGPSPHEELRWKEALCWLWREAARLTRPQRLAFLLKSTCLREMEALGLLSIRKAAAVLELPAEELAEHWSALPLEDRVIGGILRTETQQVINLRKAARVVLGRAWQRHLHER